MPAGKYREPIRVEARTETSLNTYNEVSPSWSVLLETRASLDGAGGREFAAGGGMRADVTHLLRIRSSRLARTITPKNRVILDGRTFEILAAVDRTGRRREIELQCRESV
tara:strand:- start:28108 stop:28437 length:330 start_codon:yes stop_codon:yes gene_type:complete